MHCRSKVLARKSVAKSVVKNICLLETAKLSGGDPQAWVTNVLDRIADHKIIKLDELMP